MCALGTKFAPKEMNMRRIHYISGITLCLFIGLHLCNHLISIWGVEQHIAMMDGLRLIYRNMVAESLLLGACLTQVISGIALLRKRDRVQATGLARLQAWSGIYLVVFLVIHIGAVLGGRGVLHLDTNFYFGAAGINTFPFALFFIPYYGLAIMAVTGHIAAIHGRKMQHKVLGYSPQQQAIAILVIGFCGMLAIFYGLTGHFQGIDLPLEYGVLIGN
jgi:hypothetical protein